MARLSANGTELFRLEGKAYIVSVRSNGKVLRRLRQAGGPWKIYGNAKPGLTTRELAQRSVDKGARLVDVELPELDDTRIIVSVKDAERRKANRAKRKAKPAPPLSKNSVRFNLENEADAGAALRWIVSWKILLAACGQAISCPECDAVLDGPKAVFVENPENGRAAVLCAACFDARPVFRENRFDVIDGRQLDCPQLRQAAGVLN